MTPRSSCPGGEYSPLRGANLRLNYEFNTVAENCAGGELADTTFPGQPQARSWLSYGPGSFLASRPGSFLPRAEGRILLSHGGPELQVVGMAKQGIYTYWAEPAHEAVHYC